MSYVVLPHVATGDLATAALHNQLLDDLLVLKTSINDDGSLHGCARYYDVRDDEFNLVSSTTETDMYSKSVGAGLMGTSGGLRLTFLATFLNNTGGAQSIFIRVVFGGTDVAGQNNTGTAYGGGGFAAEANRHSFWLATEIFNINSASVQRSMTRAAMGPPAANELQWGNVLNNDYQVMKSSSLAINTGSAQTLAVKATLGANNANLSFKLLKVYLELLSA